MTASDLRPTGPTRNQIADGEILVEVTGQPDALGRVEFFAYWLDSYLPPYGVRGQAFDTDLPRWIARNERGGRRVRYWSEGAVSAASERA